MWTPSIEMRTQVPFLSDSASLGRQVHETLTCLVCPGLEGNRKFMPVERELVFDIDLTDYDDVRTCGKGAHICNKCWPLMAVAIKVVNPALKRPA